MKTQIILATVASASAYNLMADADYKFMEFVSKHGKSYGTRAEFEFRAAIFKENLAFVEKHNSNPSKTFTVEVNHTSDWTKEELAKLRGYKGAKASNNEVANFDNVVADSEVDWNKKGAVTPVKNQGQCGSCWSFSTTGSVEGAHFLKTGKLVSLSEQNLCDCSWLQGNMACNGGLMDNAFKWIIKNGGIDTESSYPYTAKSSFSCKYKASDKGASISSFKDVQSGSESDLKSAVSQHPVSVAIDASHPSFQTYSTGVYHEPSCSSTALDHGVLAVGYGTEGGQDYWLVKNSWGPSWGEKGFIRMARNKNNNCGIATQASFPIV